MSRRIALSGSWTCARASRCRANAPWGVPASTDVRSKRFLLIGEREARIYHSYGRVLRTEPEVVAARFVKDGEIVVVRPDGQVEWMR